MLHDTQGRRLAYLRLSITDACNFRCSYCLPGGWRPRAGQAAPLSVDEIRRLVEAAARLGVTKVRLTGGEPTLRRDLLDIVRAVAAVPGIRRVGLTTNGHHLSRLAPALRAAGVGALNVSVDSLDPARFREVTGRGLLGDVLAGVEAALAAGLAPLKLNAVLLKGLNDGELDAFLDLTRERPVSVRFIELMQTGHAPGYFERHHLRAAHLEAELVRRGWKPRPRALDDGPAREYGHRGHAGRIGVIAPYSPDFCAGCNRLRVSSQGALRLCLFGERSDVPLRALLASDAQGAELTATLGRLATGKPAHHHLHEGRHGQVLNLAAIGG